MGRICSMNTGRSNEVGGDGDEFLVFPFSENSGLSRREKKERCGGAFVSFTVQKPMYEIGQRIRLNRSCVFRGRKPTCEIG